MSALSQKIDFSVLISVRDANPNGDPTARNRPRDDIDGFGEISDVCIKRKIRNRLQDMGESVFVQSKEHAFDGCRSLRERADSCAELAAARKSKDPEEFGRIACQKWLDVRTFGQVFAFRGDIISAGVRGAVSISMARSVSPIEIVPMKITRCCAGDTASAGKPSDTLATKYRVRFGLYRFNGCINPVAAAKTGFSEKDAETLKQAIITMFENDFSSARPEGSMEVVRVFWWKHTDSTPRISSARLYSSVAITPRQGIDRPSSADDYDITVSDLGITPEII